MSRQPSARSPNLFFIKKEAVENTQIVPSQEDEVDERFSSGNLVRASMVRFSQECDSDANPFPRDIAFAVRCFQESRIRWHMLAPWASHADMVDSRHS
jgi:hypothetical protein